MGHGRLSLANNFNLNSAHKQLETVTSLHVSE